MRRGTKHVPLLFVGGPAEKAAAVAAIFPDAVMRDDWSDLGDGIAEAAAIPPEAIGRLRARAAVGLGTKLAVEPGMRLATAEHWPHWWAAWPKQASAIRTDMGDAVVRGRALAAGWVDYKVCAVDQAWSALKLAPR